MHHFNQLGGVRVEIHHIACFLRGLGPGVHGDRHVGLRQRRGVIGSVAGHRHQTTFRLILTNQRQLGFRRGFSQEVIYPGFCRNRGSGQAVIAGDHHRFDAHFTQLGKTFFDSAFYNIFQGNHAQHAGAFGNHQRRSAKACDVFDLLLHVGREVAAVGFNVTTNSIDRPFADHTVVDVDPAHPTLGGKRYKGGV